MILTPIFSARAHSPGRVHYHVLMSFNPYGDQLTFKLKKFTVKKSSDFLGGKAEVYYIAVFLDAGINSDGNVDSWFSYQPGAGTIDVKRGDSYTYANPPALYGAASPGQQLNYSVLFYDSDEKTRNIAGDIQGAVDNPAVVAALTRYGDAMEKTAIQAATVAAAASGDVAAAAAIRDNMQVTGVISAGLELRRAVVSAILGAIAKNRDDLLAKFEGTLDASNNFRAGQSWSETGDKLDVQFMTSVIEAPPPQDKRPPVIRRAPFTIDLSRAVKLRSLKV